MYHRILKEPLLHFLLIGMLLFIYFDRCTTQRSPDDRTIEVTKADVLKMLQYQSKAFDAGHFSEKLASMSATEKQLLIEEYIREEVLYREAQQLQLQDNDYFIKRRLVQKMDFIYDQNIVDDIAISSDSLRDYFDQHTADYSVPQSYTFTHIFFKTEPGNVDLTKAKDLLTFTKNSPIAFNESTKYGQRFLYNNHYVERDLAYIAGHFGQDFADTLSTIPVAASTWQGPFLSEHGSHLVLLTAKKAGGIADFETLKNRIESDYKNVLQKRRKQEFLKAIISQYTINVNLDK